MPGYWILHKECGCPIFAIADGALSRDGALAKVLTPIISEAATMVTHITTEDPVSVYTLCPHEIKQLEFEETRRQEQRQRNPTPPDMLANFHNLDKFAGETHTSATAQSVAAALQEKIDADHDEALAEDAQRTADAADDAADAALDEYETIQNEANHA